MTVTLRQARRIVVAVLGATVVLIGVAMLVLPGPGLVVTGIGLAILSSEFVWARRWLRSVRDRITGGDRSGSRGARGPDPPEAPDERPDEAQGESRRRAGDTDRRPD
jgi:hypothetical protein